MRRVGRDREGACVTGAHQQSVHEQIGATRPFEVDVCQPPPVDVVQLPVIDQPHPPAAEQLLGVGRRLWPIAAHRTMRVDGLRGVDAEQPHVEAARAGPHVHRIAVHHPHDRPRRRRRGSIEAVDEHDGGGRDDDGCQQRRQEAQSGHTESLPAKPSRVGDRV